MVARARTIAAEYEGRGGARTSDVAAEAGAVADFVRWLIDGACVFLGYREYALTEAEGRLQVAVRPGSGLGLLRREDRSAFAGPRPLDELPALVRALGGRRLLTVAKTIAVAGPPARAHGGRGRRQLDVTGQVIGGGASSACSPRAPRRRRRRTSILRKMLRQRPRSRARAAGATTSRRSSPSSTRCEVGLLASAPADVRGHPRRAGGAAREETSRSRSAARRQPASRCSWSCHGELPGRVRAGPRRAAALGNALEEHVQLGLGERAHSPPPRTLDVRPGELADAVVRIVRTWTSG
jgi:hypothetical protein